MKKYLFLIIFIIFLFSFNIKAEVEYNKIKVDIKGEVKYPGLYELDYGSTIYDAIKYAGGLLISADTSIINLSKKLNDEDVVIIYSFEEVDKMKNGNTSVIILEKECMCPKIESVGCIKELNTKLININTATKEELLSLPSIGEAKAKAIIEYRNNTPFKDIKDIMNIKGIGSSIFDKIKELITV